MFSTSNHHSFMFFTYTCSMFSTANHPSFLLFTYTCSMFPTANHLPHSFLFFTYTWTIFSTANHHSFLFFSYTVLVPCSPQQTIVAFCYLLTLVSCSHQHTITAFCSLLILVVPCSTASQPCEGPDMALNSYLLFLTCLAVSKWTSSLFSDPSRVRVVGVGVLAVASSLYSPPCSQISPELSL